MLTEHGYLWSGDHADCDRPQVQATAAGPLVRMMHSEYSDVRDGGNPRAYLHTHHDLVDSLLAGEPGASTTITLHAHVSGRPVLARYADRVLAYVERHRDDLWITTYADLARAVRGTEVAA
ncbi:hypothetical protein BC739_001742 [Kutzneria viridogrisea]|uniref:Polysaccharide deacetylase n=1 Tax=Kutzneria viridogrisea TaxID=47990 RepID=A0ABR6BCE1_9PSEU|nr:hypothetical protein [Kutzneria viridogrisea]